jgi:hypothetical protein
MSRDISKLSPYMQVKYQAFKKQCDAEKLGVIIVCTDRGEIEQESAFESGHSRAHFGQSAHNAVLPNGKPASEAFDFGIILNGKYIGDSEHANYQRAGAIGESLGLKWYGNKKWGFYEAAHLQNMKWIKPKKEIV